MSSPRTADEFIADTEARAAELRALLANMQPSRDWVVLTFHKLPLAFDISRTGDITNPRVVRIEAATPFNEPTARSVAPKVKDGGTRPGVAYPYRVACEIVLAETESVLEFMRAARAAQKV